MWDNAPLLRNIANTLFVFSVGAALYGAAYYVTHLPGLFPLHSVRLSAVPQRVEAEKVLRVARNEVQGNFFTVDIERLRKSLEKLPWVRNVSIRREFPDSLEVRLEEHQVLGRWNGAALVNRQGEVFVADSEKMVPEAAPRAFPYGDSKQALPDFVGPDGEAVEVTRQYAQFNQQLAELNLQADQIVLSPRHAWQLHLSNGMVLELGREDMQQRLARFVEVYPYSLAAQKIEDRKQRTEGAVAYVDLRYRNGFAVRRITNDRG